MLLFTLIFHDSYSLYIIVALFFIHMNYSVVVYFLGQSNFSQSAAQIFCKLFSFMFWFGIFELCFTLLYPNRFMNAMADFLILFDFLVHKLHLWFTDSNFCFLYFYSNQHHPVFPVRLWVLLFLPVNPCYMEFFYATYFNPHFTNSLILIY